MRLLLALLLLVPAASLAQSGPTEPITQACSEDPEIGFWYGELVITAPEHLAGSYVTGAMSQGGDEQWPDTTGLLPPGTSGEIVIARDPGANPGDDPDEGCPEFTNADEVEGNIALIRRGACSFALKSLNAYSAGAIGFIVYNDERTEDGQGNEVTDHTIINMAWAGTLHHNVPGLFISRHLGNQIVSAIEVSDETVTGTMRYQACYVPVATEASNVPGRKALVSPHPNPFARTTAFDLTLDRAQYVTVAVYDVLGRRVVTLHEGPLAAATHALTFEAGALPAGVYVVRATGEAFAQTRRVVLTR